MKVSKGAEAMGVAIKGQPDFWRVSQIFTTYRGDWDWDSPRYKDIVYNIPRWASEDVANKPEGGDHHIYVRTEAGTVPTPIVSYGMDGDVRVQGKLTDWQWDNLPVYNAYKPGDHPGWEHWIEEGGQVVIGGGLPNSEHVSLFVVWEENDGTVDPPPIDPDVVEVQHISKNGQVVAINPHGFAFQVVVKESIHG